MGRGNGFRQGEEIDMRQRDGSQDTSDLRIGDEHLAASRGEAVQLEARQTAPTLGAGGSQKHESRLETGLGAGLDTAGVLAALPWHMNWVETTLRRWFPAVLPASQPTASRLTNRAVAGSPQPPPGPEGIAMLAHDVRNMLTALELYCNLLEEPGVLQAPYRHYAGELRMVADASRGLIFKLEALDARSGQSTGLERTPNPAQRLPPSENPFLREDFTRSTPVLFLRASTAEASTLKDSNPASYPMAESDFGAHTLPNVDLFRASATAPAGLVAEKPRVPSLSSRPPVSVSGQPISNLAEELLANKNLLSAMAGPGITLGMHFDGGARPICFLKEDLTRVLVNLIKNSTEAMPFGGHIQIGVEEKFDTLSLVVSDNGCGIEDAALEEVFAPGYSTHLSLAQEKSAWPAQHHGLGLAIVRSLMIAAGGSVWATHSPASSQGGSGPGERYTLSGQSRDLKQAAHPQTGITLHLEFPKIPGNAG